MTQNAPSALPFATRAGSPTQRGHHAAGAFYAGSAVPPAHADLARTTRRPPRSRRSIWIPRLSEGHDGRGPAHLSSRTAPIGPCDRSRDSPSRAEQVPTIALQVHEHCDPAVRLIPWRRHEADARVDHSLVSAIEVVDAKEQADAAGELLADRWRADARRLPSRAGCRSGLHSGRTTTQRFGRPSLVSDGVSSTSSNCSTSTKKRIAAS